MPQMPGTSGMAPASGSTAQSQVEVPMILTSVPVRTPAPIAPRCASKAPIAMGMPWRSRSVAAHSAPSAPAGRSSVWASS